VYTVFEGSSRVLQTAGGVEYSRDFPVLPFRGASVGPSGALWTTFGGLVYRTPNVTGPLTPIESLNAWSVAVVGAFGFACTTDGTLVRLPMSGSPALTALDVSCDQLEVRGDTLFVGHARRWTRSSDAGASFESSPSLPPAELEHDRYTQTLLLDDPVRTGLDMAARTWRTGDALLYTSTANRLRFHEASESVPSPDPEGLLCWPHSTVTGPVSVCTSFHDDTLPGIRVFDWDDEWVERVVLPSDTRHPPTLQTAADVLGGGVAVPGVCTGDSAARSDTCICWIPKGAPPTTVSLVVEPPQSPCDPDDTWCSQEFNDAAPPKLQPIQVEYPYLIYRFGSYDMPAHITDMRVADGTPLPPCTNPRLVGWGHLQCDGSDGAALWVLGDATPQQRSLPEGAISTAFASWTRGIAAGRFADALWSTTDGGRSWQPLPVDIDGRTDSLPVGEANCSNVACNVSTIVWASPRLRSQLAGDPVTIVGFEHPVDLSMLPNSDWGRW
jgi:hypothetical protein